MKRAAVGAAALTVIAGVVGVVANGTASQDAARCHIADLHGQEGPDRTCTPGRVDTTLTAAGLCPHANTVARRSVSAATKRIVLRSYGLDPVTFHGEVDHLVSLELGGTNDVHNLWPQAGSVPNAKDRIENQLHADLCAGHMTLHDIQQHIAADWTTAERNTP